MDQYYWKRQNKARETPVNWEREAMATCSHSCRGKKNPHKEKDSRKCPRQAINKLKNASKQEIVKIWWYDSPKLNTHRGKSPGKSAFSNTEVGCFFLSGIVFPQIASNSKITQN